LIVSKIRVGAHAAALGFSSGRPRWAGSVELI